MVLFASQVLVTRETQLETLQSITARLVALCHIYSMICGDRQEPTM